MSVEQAVQRLYHRLRNLVYRGRVTLGDDTGPVQTQQVRLGADDIRDALPRLAEYGLTSMPPEGSDAIVLFPAGDRGSGVIIATGHQTYRLKSLKAGEVALYDNLGQSVYLTQAGIVVNGGGLPMKFTNTPSVTLDTPTVHCTGNLDVDGNIVAQGDISDHNNKSMADMRTVFDGHDHNDPQGGTVGGPNQSM
jgi:phage baseplate assembly protein V